MLNATTGLCSLERRIFLIVEVNLPCACAVEICRSGSISKNHQLTNLNMCGKFHACIRNSTILALSRLANERSCKNLFWSIKISGEILDKL